MERKTLSRHLMDLELEGSFDRLRKYLDEIEKQYGKDWQNLRIVEESAYEGGYYYYLYGDRLETDEELNNRIAVEKKREEEQWQREKDHYLKLKAKFEP